MSYEWILIILLSVALCSSFSLWLLVVIANSKLLTQRYEFEHWLSSNLVVMRVHCARVSPEATSVIDSLERALPALKPVNGESLENYLYVLKRARESRLLESVTPYNDAAAPLRR